MDSDASILQQQMEELEGVVLDDQHLLGTMFAIILLGAIEARRLQTERRKPSREFSNEER